MVGQVRDDCARNGIRDRCARRDLDDHILRVFAVHALAHPVLSALGLKVFLITEIHQRAQAFVHLKDDVSPFAAVATRGTAVRHIFFPAERDHSIAAVPAFYVRGRLLVGHLQDRVGVLFAITHCLHRLGLVIHLAKITTQVHQVLDVFYVTDADGVKITDAERLAAVRAEMTCQLEQLGAPLDGEAAPA